MSLPGTEADVEGSDWALMSNVALRTMAATMRCDECIEGIARILLVEHDSGEHKKGQCALNEWMGSVIGPKPRHHLSIHPQLPSL